VRGTINQDHHLTKIINAVIIWPLSELIKSLPSVNRHRSRSFSHCRRDAWVGVDLEVAAHRRVAGKS